VDGKGNFKIDSCDVEKHVFYPFGVGMIRIGFEDVVIFGIELF
jgi:hypothetical protein